ncbi:SDR family oxidoreductase [Mycobacterium sp. KBS0706]|uniref:SDR family oxidoreductase n=1 Tax=Mycobacterium sp. KBS0706 TaxID=2578109 RepID=UPI0027D1EC46|nr:SDR family oxidoreductase [Mycobacterium sp. KBS0706]
MEGKVIAVTGASSGIGEAVARHFAKAGAAVMLGARRLHRLEVVADEIRRDGGRAALQRLDVTRREDAEAFVQAAVAQFGRLDVIVNNAGVMPLSPVADLKVEEWDRMVDVNLKGVLYGVAAALPVFQAQGSGHVVNVTSVADRRIVPTAAVYSATKYAVRAFSEGLRQEIGGGIRVTVVAPGATESELANGISDRELRRAAIEDYRRDLLPADSIAHAIAYAVAQPPEVDVNEVVVRPTAQAY